MLFFQLYTNKSEVEKRECTYTDPIGWPWSSRSTGTCLSGNCPAWSRGTPGPNWVFWWVWWEKTIPFWLSGKKGCSPQHDQPRPDKMSAGRNKWAWVRPPGPQQPSRKATHLLGHKDVPPVALGGLLGEASATVPKWGEAVLVAAPLSSALGSS